MNRYVSPLSLTKERILREINNPIKETEEVQNYDFYEYKNRTKKEFIERGINELGKDFEKMFTNPNEKIVWHYSYKSYGLCRGMAITLTDKGRLIFISSSGHYEETNFDFQIPNNLIVKLQEIYPMSKSKKGFKSTILHQNVLNYLKNIKPICLHDDYSRPKKRLRSIRSVPNIEENLVSESPDLLEELMTDPPFNFSDAKDSKYTKYPKDSKDPKYTKDPKDSKDSKDPSNGGPPDAFTHEVQEFGALLDRRIVKTSGHMQGTLVPLSSGYIHKSTETLDILLRENAVLKTENEEKEKKIKRLRDCIIDLVSDDM